MSNKNKQSQRTSHDSARFLIPDAEVKVTKLSVRDGEIFRSMLADPTEPSEALLKAAERYRRSVKRK